MSMRSLIVILLLSSSVLVTGQDGYNRDVRPILADKCFRCHGPDAAARKGDLRLDRPDSASVLKSGLIDRITHRDESERMPPPESGQRLKAAEVERLVRWMKGGARYEQHWSLVPPKKSVVLGTQSAYSRNAIDSFILARLQREGIPRFSFEATRETLIRRVALALTGIPPTIGELDAFLADGSPDAYERVVDRFLRSPRYGVKMAGPWLDAARYADTNGYFTDNARTMWPWRDWVIRAFNRNMPFDRFTIEQLAGDLLPNPTLDQKIATGFNRNHMVNNETGIIPEEFRVEYVADRVKTTSTIWMGLTVECARCHDHKYDPISQQDYYRFFSFFNNVPEKGLDGGRGNAVPVLNVASSEQKRQLAKLGAELKDAEQAFKSIDSRLHTSQILWEKDALSQNGVATSNGLMEHNPLDQGTPPKSISFKSGFLGNAANFAGGAALELTRAVNISRDQPFSAGAWINPSSAGCVISKIDDANRMRGFDLVLRKGKALVHLVHTWNQNDIEIVTVDAVPSRQWNHLMFTYDGSGRAAGVQVYLNGIPQSVQIRRDSLSGEITNTEPLRIGRRQASASYKGKIDDLRIYDRALSAPEVKELAISQFLRGVLSIDPAKRDRFMKERLRAHFFSRSATEEEKRADQRLKALRTEMAEFKTGLPVMMVMAESAKPRQAYLLERGEYNKPGVKLNAGVPLSLPQLRDGMSADRLGLAKWLMARENPLTARVMVNRIWAQLFGRGIVATPEDFGTQGDWPEHPELLDWLACEFRDKGWDIKELIRLIVSSTTFRQSSNADPALIQRDPDNRLLARGPRFRMDAETMRDSALAVGGLLVDQSGGASVKPYQPAGLWREVTYDGDLAYNQATGASLYRRSLYTYWKRQVPPPNMLLFDAPTRDTCTVARPRTNTPLQALALMNDPTFVEAARALAARMMRESSSGSRQRVHYGFRAVTARVPSDHETNVLLGIYLGQLQAFSADPLAARELLRVGSSVSDSSLDQVELAALTTVANLILSLDEAITRQ
jgi:hypothetical protein